MIKFPFEHRKNERFCGNKEQQVTNERENSEEEASKSVGCPASRARETSSTKLLLFVLLYLTRLSGWRVSQSKKKAVIGKM